jgi:hypothetical protein
MPDEGSTVVRRKVVTPVVAATLAAVGASSVLLYVNGLADKAQASEDLVSSISRPSWCCWPQLSSESNHEARRVA